MMTTAIPFAIPRNRWNAADTARLDGPGLLLHRSNLLGGDLTITNFGGGNTSAKLAARDPLTGEDTAVLWVKGSGGDLGSMKLDGFATLYQDKLLRLEKLYGGVEREDEMVGYLPHCTFNLNPRAASIDTPLHAYLPFIHIDHVHPDAVIALAAAKDGERLTRDIYGGEVGWLAWKRPGFDLGLRLRDYVATNPGARGVVLAGHGLICWGDSSKACYDNTIDLVARAANHLNTRLEHGPAFGGQSVAPLPASERRRAAARLAPRLRGLMSKAEPKAAHFADDAETIEFVCSADMARLAALGTSCPDHFLRTKIAPLVLDPAQIDDDAYLATALEDYRARYAAYYQRHAGPADPKIRDANPVIVLIPGIGRFAFARDKVTARLASEFFGNAINVMRGAETAGGYLGLDEAEAFAIEYWALEEAKLQRMPKPKPLEGRIALVTGAGGGIGSAAARALLSDGACVVLADMNPETLGRVHAETAAAFGKDRVRAAICDVTDEAQVQAAFDLAAVEFGGLDILIANAGLASSAPIELTTMELWRQNYGVLADGYFLTARAAWPLLKQQGGAVVFIGSKNAIAAPLAASAYASAKAASLHLARCLALEGAAHAIRVNVVNPDAVLRGSKIWDGNWRNERARAYGVNPGEALEQLYRERSLLKRDVLPEDIAAACLFLVSDASAKSTGNILNVDAGNAMAFTR